MSTESSDSSFSGRLPEELLPELEHLSRYLWIISVFALPDSRNLLPDLCGPSYTGTLRALLTKLKGELSECVAHIDEAEDPDAEQTDLFSRTAARLVESVNVERSMRIVTAHARHVLPASIYANTDPADDVDDRSDPPLPFPPRRAQRENSLRGSFLRSIDSRVPHPARDPFTEALPEPVNPFDTNPRQTWNPLFSLHFTRNTAAYDQSIYPADEMNVMFDDGGEAFDYRRDSRAVPGHHQRTMHVPASAPRDWRTASLDSTVNHDGCRSDNPGPFTWIGKVYAQQSARYESPRARFDNTVVITKFTRQFVRSTLDGSHFTVANKIFEDLLQQMIIDKLNGGDDECVISHDDVLLKSEKVFAPVLFDLRAVSKRLGAALKIDMTNPRRLDPYILTSDLGEALEVCSLDGTADNILMQCRVARADAEQILFTRHASYIHVASREGFCGQVFNLKPRVYEPFFIMDPQKVHWSLAPDIPWLVYNKRQETFTGIAPNFQQKTAIQTSLIATYVWYGVYREIQQFVEIVIDLGLDPDYGRMGFISLRTSSQGEKAVYTATPTAEEDKSTDQADVTSSSIQSSMGPPVVSVPMSLPNATTQIVAEIVPSYEASMSFARSRITGDDGEPCNILSSLTWERVRPENPAGRGNDPAARGDQTQGMSRDMDMDMDSDTGSDREFDSVAMAFADDSNAGSCQ
ncbi:hypothetical protein BZA70DRAFT_270276 [Myxozyma melibiosi]|uniref:Uncharacterized protein n=1 Tax=Myxozyma melibiosi TaxID=54550 RepID=A0ABR1FBB7_9ASCO